MGDGSRERYKDNTDLSISRRAFEGVIIRVWDKCITLRCKHNEELCY